MSNSKKTLLLSANYEPLSFINERKAIKLVINDKVEILNNWQEKIVFSSGSFHHPATLKLKTLFKRKFVNNSFNRQIMIKRDQSCCMYCGRFLAPSQITVDHVIPRSLGGKTSFTNCVCSCFECNNKKGNKTPEQAGLTLLRKPEKPIFMSDIDFYYKHDHWHDDWHQFLTK